MKLTMGQAAKQVNCSKATLSRAIKEGRLSAEKREDGSYAIDPSELQGTLMLRSIACYAKPLRNPLKRG